MSSCRRRFVLAASSLPLIYIFDGDKEWGRQNRNPVSASISRLKLTDLMVKRDKNASENKAATSETSWITRLPAKSFRFVLAFGLGAALEVLYPSGLGLAASAGLAATDQLLLDPLLRGWRPSQFVEGPLQKFGS
jgi:hypothetical protein